MNQKAWWKESVIYQIYPRSFKDSNKDGIGDLQGIIQQLDYLKYLGIDVIWLCPFYPSPNVDNGYDISDYTAISPEFGTMNDFEELVSQMKQRNLRLIIDLVANHCSNLHPWFQEARKSKDNFYRNYFIWHEGENGQPPNDWQSFFGGNAWTYNEATSDYYLHLFTPAQPDFNWDYKLLRSEIYRIMRFWLDKGVDGFRMDVISFISKQDISTSLQNSSQGIAEFYANGAKVHDYLQEMHEEVLRHYDVMTVGEGAGVKAEVAPLYVGSDRQELNMIFHFEHTSIDRDPKNFWQGVDWELSDLKIILNRWDAALAGKGWSSIYLGNHDLPRIVSRFGNDGEYRVISAKMLATLLLTLRGTPYLYQGDEIGMTNYPFTSIDEFRDVVSINAYITAKQQGESWQSFLNNQLQVARDHARTPMQWDNSKNAAFSVGRPWINVNPNYEEINAAQVIVDPNSIFNYYKQLIQLRKKLPVLIYGDYTMLDISHPYIYAYLRTDSQHKVLILLNFLPQNITVDLSSYLSDDDKLLISNYQELGQRGTELVLRPYEANIYSSCI
ncbi:MAG: alpha-glucosidase [Spirirestis rafaelensis WJT71-NPBG6]|nr:alpha-glucosidase [Spirirestis rafaelensis WJT71-NPBG6]